MSSSALKIEIQTPARAAQQSEIALLQEQPAPRRPRWLQLVLDAPALVREIAPGKRPLDRHEWEQVIDRPSIY